MKTLTPGLILTMLIAGNAAANESDMKDLAPTGKLRVGVVFAPTMSTFFVVKDADGIPRGVTVDLGETLANKLNVPVEFVLYPNSGQATDAVESGAVDVSFMPVDEERKKRIAFGPDYVRAESTYMVTAASGAKTVADVDKAGMRVIGIANTTTIRSAARVLKSATIVAVPSVAEAMDMLRGGGVEAFALSRDSLRPYQAQLPGARILEGQLQTTGIAIAVPKNRPAALAHASAFIEDAKSSGLVRRAFDQAGLQSEAVAPADGHK